MPDKVDSYDPAQAELYEQRVSEGQDVILYAERFSADGTTMRMRARWPEIRRQVDDFEARHPVLVSKTEALAEREARREAAFRAVGKHADYRPKRRPNIKEGAGG